MNKSADNISQAIILAGGFGTRLQSRVSDRPKALAEIKGKAFLDFQLEWLMDQGISKVYLATHFMAEQLEEFVSNWKNPQLEIVCVYETTPLGTGGAVHNVIQQQNLKGHVLVLNGDTFFKFQFNNVESTFNNHRPKALLVAGHQEDVARFGTLHIENGFVKSFFQASGKHEPGLVNCGAYILSTGLFDQQELAPQSLEHDLFPSLSQANDLMAHIIQDKLAFFDIGTPESYDEICNSEGEKC
jgi:D-glycero-alpha-D-manno-heptose 1-phosphate guanylyltransferase